MNLKYYLIFIFAVISSFCLRDFHYGNELTYINIVDDALKNGSFFTFSKHGAIYADKPPLYFWIIMLGKWLLGYHSVLFIGLYSLIPALIILFIMNKLSVGLNNKDNCLLAPIMLMTTIFFIGCSAALRMDMLMSMFIILSLYTFYSMYMGKYTLYNRLIFPVWIFLAIFSKGIAGFFIPFLSIVAFLFAEKKIKSFFKFWGWRTWLILVFLISAWLFMVNAEGGFNYLYNLLYHQNIDRIINSFSHKRPFYFYFKNFWYVIGPWSLLVIGSIIIRIKKKEKFNDLEKLYVCIIATSTLLFSLASGKLNIYLLPIIPFIIYLSGAWIEKFETNKYLRYLFIISIFLIVLAQPILYMWTEKQNIFLNLSLLRYAAIFLLSCGSFLILFSLFKNQRLIQAITKFSLLFLVFINLINFTLPSFQNNFSYKELSEEILIFANSRNINTFYFYNIANAKNLKYYLNEEVYELKGSHLSNLLASNGILICRNKDLCNNESLKAIINSNDYITKNDYTIIKLP
jgi:4-amino-4-deoxy-L-arabinose transferase-like glycosyltransferase